MNGFHSWILIFTISTAFTQSLVGQELDYETVRVAEDVYLFMPSERGIGNSVVIINDRDVLVVDATATPLGARSIIKEIKKLTDKQVRYIVNTHWHDDHIWGNQAYSTAFPNVEFIAHTNTRRDVLEVAVPGLAQNIENIRNKIEERDAILKKGAESDGQSLSENRKNRLEQRQELFRQVLGQFESVEPKPPTLTLQDSLVIHRGDSPIRILYLGRGHTRGDLVVHLPTKRILITGDLLTFPIPSGSFIIDWIDTLKKLATFDIGVIVPGHGPVMHDRQYLTLIRKLLESVVSQVAQAIDEGLSLEEIHKLIDVEDFRLELAKNEPVPQQAFEAFFLKIAVEQTYNELMEGMHK